jgi:hypothetical protein
MFTEKKMSKKLSWGTSFLLPSFFVGMVIGHYPPISEKNWPWEALSAIGTIAAALVALGIATADSRRRKREAVSLAIVTASRLLFQLSRMSLGANAVHMLMQQAIKVDPNKEQFDYMFQVLNDNRALVDSAQIASLLPLSNDVAKLLAEALGAYEFILKSMDKVLNMYGQENLNAARKRLIANLEIGLEEVSGKLSIVANEFERYRVGSPKNATRKGQVG